MEKTMATAKKSPAKKKATTRKAPTKQATTVRRSKATPAYQSFKLSSDPQKFMSTTLTIQTLYWVILSLVVLLFGLWMIDTNARIQELYDSIDRDTLSSQELSVPMSSKNAVKN